MNRAEQRTQRRRRIVAEARRLFAERGVEHTRMKDIASAAGCTRRTLYAHYQSWEDVALAVEVENLRRRWAIQGEAMEAGASGLARLRIWARTFYAFAKENPHLLRFQFFWDYRGFRAEQVSPVGLAEWERVNELMAEGLRRAVSAGQWDGSIRRELDVDTCIGQFATTLRAVMHRALFPAQTSVVFVADDFVASYIDLFLQGIAAPATEPA